MKCSGFHTPCSRLAFIPLLLLLIFMVSGCQKVDKPVRGEAGSGPMAIVIEGDPPDSHTRNRTSAGKKLVNPYTKIPLLDGLFKSRLKGLDYWKANHPVLTTGTHDPALIAGTDEETEGCLDCHDQEVSCNNCHSYVGVRPITKSEPAS